MCEDLYESDKGHSCDFLFLDDFKKSITVCEAWMHKVRIGTMQWLIL